VTTARLAPIAFFAAAIVAAISGTWKIACGIESLAAPGSRLASRNSGEEPALAVATEVP